MSTLKVKPLDLKVVKTTRRNIGDRENEDIRISSIYYCDATSSYNKDEEQMEDIPLIEIVFHWPHDRLALGWDWIRPDEKYDYTTVRLYLLITTITINYGK